MMKKIMALLLTLTLIFGVTGTTLAAEDPVTITSSNWIEHGSPTAPDMSVNDGSTTETAIQISTAEEFAWVAQQLSLAATSTGSSGTQFAGKYMKLMNDINLYAHLWVPIGYDWSFPFMGHFDGGGYTIRGLTINDTTHDLIGLFGYIYDGSLSNLTISGDGVVTSSFDGAYVGAFVGDMWKVSVSNLHNGADVVFNGNNGYIGGIYGFGDTYAVTNCSNSGTITAANGCVGGIAGDTGGSTEAFDTFPSRIEGSFNTGAIILGSSESGGGKAGGIAGRQSNRGIIINCYNTGSVTLYGDVNDAYDTFAGGIVGVNTSMDSPAVISHCYNIGKVESLRGAKVFIGGIVGKNGWGSEVGSVERCVALNQSVLNANEAATAHRIAGVNEKYLWQNYAWVGMEMANSGTPVSTMDNSTSLDGGDISAISLVEFWATNWTAEVNGWDSAIWDLPSDADPYTLPVLIGNDAFETSAMPSYLVPDTTAPTVSSINRQTPAGEVTNATSVVYRVTFSEAVSGVDTSDFSLMATGSATGSIESVSDTSGTTIDVTVNSVTGVGTLRLDLNSSGTGITDIVGTAIASGYTDGQIYTVDTTAPTLQSAVRDSNTQITVTLSEDSQNLTKANSGGFTVSETGTPGTTYVVRAIAQGLDSSHVVLTVADLEVSATKGLTVTYTAGTDGTIQDLAGNAMATNGTGITIDAWKTTVYVSVNPDGSGTVEGDGDYAYFSQVTLTANANSGYKFISWTENGKIVGRKPTYSFTLGTTDRNLEANFKAVRTKPVK